MPESATNDNSALGRHVRIFCVFMYIQFQSCSKLYTERTGQVFVECVLFYFSLLETNPSADAKHRKNLEYPYKTDDLVLTKF